MKVTTSGLKKLVIALIAVPMFATLLFTAMTTKTRAADEFDAAAFYKAKCAMCHGAKAEKKFDAAKPEAELIETTLKGKDSTPKMPSYEKSVSADQAKLLIDYMKSLKQ